MLTLSLRLNRATMGLPGWPFSGYLMMKEDTTERRSSDEAGVLCGSHLAWKAASRGMYVFQEADYCCKVLVRYVCV